MFYPNPLEPLTCIYRERKTETERQRNGNRERTTGRFKVTRALKKITQGSEIHVQENEKAQIKGACAQGVKILVTKLYDLTVNTRDLHGRRSEPSPTGRPQTATHMYHGRRAHPSQENKSAQ